MVYKYNKKTYLNYEENKYKTLIIKNINKNLKNNDKNLFENVTLLCDKKEEFEYDGFLKIIKYIQDFKLDMNKDLTNDNYSAWLQDAGDNIRKCGDPFDFSDNKIKLQNLYSISNSYILTFLNLVNFLFIIKTFLTN